MYSILSTYTHCCLMVIKLFLQVKIFLHSVFSSLLSFSSVSVCCELYPVESYLMFLCEGAFFYCTLQAIDEL